MLFELNFIFKKWPLIQIDMVHTYEASAFVQWLKKKAHKKLLLLTEIM